MNRVFLTLFAIVAALAMFIVYYYWDSGTNRGRTAGYYGRFNSVSNALAGLQGVTILDCWLHGDITLEEFEFKIKTSDGLTQKLFFAESSPIRELVGDQLTNALLKEIELGLTAQATNSVP